MEQERDRDDMRIADVAVEKSGIGVDNNVNESEGAAERPESVQSRGGGRADQSDAVDEHVENKQTEAAAEENEEQLEGATTESEPENKATVEKNPEQTEVASSVEADDSESAAQAEEDTNSKKNPAQNASQVEVSVNEDYVQEATDEIEPSEEGAEEQSPVSTPTQSGICSARIKIS